MRPGRRGVGFRAGVLPSASGIHWQVVGPAGPGPQQGVTAARGPSRGATAPGASYPLSVESPRAIMMPMDATGPGASAHDPSARSRIVEPHGTPRLRGEYEALAQLQMSRVLA
jgi:hypothetical protein